MERSAANLRAAKVNPAVIGMKLTVCVFERFLNALDIIHDIERPDEVDVHTGCISDKAEQHALFSFAHMNIQPHAAEPFHKVGKFILARLLFQKYDHFDFLRYAETL